MASLPTTKWTTPVQFSRLAKRLYQAKLSGSSVADVRGIIDKWMATVFDFHPWLKKNPFGALLNGSEKDIFVETRLLRDPPAGASVLPYTRVDIEQEEEGEEEEGQRETCYTSPPLYAVSRSWHDGGNPTMTTVASVSIVVSADKTRITVAITLEDDRAAEVLLWKYGDAWNVNPQQGEVAEFVKALAGSTELEALHLLRGASLKHEGVDVQRCVRLFCGCNQFVNTSISDFLKCTYAGADDPALIERLYDTVWHYSMPHDPSSWDKSHTQTCFDFLARLVALADETCVILQPECGWLNDHEGRIKVVEDASLVWGWQRDPVLHQEANNTRDIGRISPHCIMKMTEADVRGILEADKVSSDWLQDFISMFNFPGRRSGSRSRSQDTIPYTALENLCEYLQGPTNIPPACLPTRLWNVRTNQVVEDLPRGTTYCAVSYVWGQWRKKSPDHHDRYIPDLDRIRNSLWGVANETGVDYFWVDGNCILQNDGADKARELPKMGQYYSGAAFTLVLVPDVTAHQSNALAPTPMPWQIFDANAHRERNQKMVDQYLNCQWLRRIWTMQEAWLARKLVFKTGAGQLVRGDYLELLRVIGPVADKGPAPVCLEWMNIGPVLVFGAASGELIIQGDWRDTPTLLTRPAGALVHQDACNDGTGLQARTTSLHRALRLCNGRFCDRRKPSGKLLGLLGMVDRGAELTERAVEAVAAVTSPGCNLAPEENAEQAFRLAVEMRMLGPEIMLCGTPASKEPRSSWLPELRNMETGVQLPYIASQVLEDPPAMRVDEKYGAIVEAIEASLTDFRLERRNTVHSGETAFVYSCKWAVSSSGRHMTGGARIETVDLIRQKTRMMRRRSIRVLLLQRPSQSGPFISIRFKPTVGRFCRRKQGFLLMLTKDVPLEQECRDGFDERIIQ